jgi:hypothetical protein
MKLTESKLKKIIFEELELMVESGELDEGFLDRLKARTAGLGDKLKAGASSVGSKAASALGADTVASQMADKSKQRTSDSKNKAIMSLRKNHAVKLKKIQQALQKSMQEALKDGRAVGLSPKEVQMIIFKDLQDINASLMKAIKRMASGND